MFFLVRWLACGDGNADYVKEPIESVITPPPPPPPPPSQKKLEQSVAETKAKLDCIEEILLSSKNGDDISVECASYIQECSY